MTKLKGFDMLNKNIIAIDLAKTTLQVCHISKDGELLSNKAMSRQRTSEFLIKSEPSIVAMEGCCGCHYWGRMAEEYGHEVRIINPKKVKRYLEGHKTDNNDALAIANAALQIGLKYSKPKSIERQSLQSLENSRRFLTRSKANLGLHIRGVLLGCGIVHPKGEKGLSRAVLETIENNILPVPLLKMIGLLWEQYRELKQEISKIDVELDGLIINIEECKRLTKLEGVGTSSAVSLYIALGSGEQFQNGRQASAFVGLTPKQHSSGGKAKMVGIDKNGGVKDLRSLLYLGAMSYISRLSRSKPKTRKDEWILATLQRVGYKKTCIALANKTVRTAWAILKHNTKYQPEFLTA